MQPFDTEDSNLPPMSQQKSYTCGIHAVLELVAYGGFLPQDKIFTSRKFDDLRLKSFFYKAKKNSVPVEQKSFAELDALLKNILQTSPDKKIPARHQGLVLERQNHLLLPQITEETILQNCLQKKFSLYVVADGITDPQNLGAMSRSLLAFNGMGLVLGQKNSTPLGMAALKASAGALSKLPTCRVKSLSKFLHLAQEHNAYIIAAAMQGTSLNPRWAEGIVALNKSVFLIMGSEEKGVSPSVEELCDEIVTIGQSVRIQSLNVSVSTGILLQAFYQAAQRQLP